VGWIPLATSLISPRTQEHLCFVIRRTLHYALGCFRTIVETPPGAVMSDLKTPRETDVERLSRFAFFSWLTPSEIKLLVASLVTANWGRGGDLS
jgi:hypothetical protein